ncbi:TolC family protein [Novipirellula rosea]|uniref:Outer membrane efflux protein n=1 Tax=Novipirellula rosea TaxID=1031540 RepID=A0ABP8NNT9_9BACT
MQPQQINTFSISRKRKMLALSLIAISVGGCASGPARLARSQYTAPSQVVAEEVETNAVVNQQNSRNSKDSAVTMVGYGEQTSSSEIVFAQQFDLDPPILATRNGEEMGNPNQTLVELQTDENDSSEEGESGDSDVEGTVAIPVATAANGLPVDYFVRQALAAHPSIQAARQRVQAEYERIPQVTALPDPQLNNTFWPLQDNALQTAGGRIANQMSLQQGIPYPDKLRTKGTIVSREAQMAQAEVQRIERQITESVRLAYYEVWYATRAIQIIEETRDLVDDLTKVAEARYRSGGTQQDVLRAQLETDRLDDQLVQLRKQKQVSQADLAALLQQPLSLMPEVLDELGLANAPMQLDELIAQAEQCNPNLQGLAAEIQRDRQKQRLACLQKYPDLMVGLNWGIVSDKNNVLSGVADGHDNLSFTVGTTLPIWREKINAGVREASRRTSSTQQRLEAERDEIYGRLRRLLAQADSLVEQTDIYENRLVPRTEDTLKLAIADYRGERTDFFTLIETYRELLMFETQLARINATLAGTIAQVDRTVGCAY